MHWGIPTAIPLIALASYAFLLLITVRHGLGRRPNDFFAMYLLAMIVWSFGAFMMYGDSANAPFWNKIMLGGLVGMPLTFFLFIRAFLRKGSQAWLVYGAYILLGILLLLIFQGYMTRYITITDQGLLLYEFGPAAPVFAVYFSLLVGASAAYLVRAHGQSQDSVERNRVGYALLALSVVALGGATNAIAALGAYPIDIGANVISAMLLAYAIFRYRLLDIDVSIRKGLRYSVPTAIIGAGYLFIVFLAVNLLHLVLGFQVLLLSLVLAALIALALQPVWSRMQAWVDRLFFRERYDASLMVQRLSRTAASVLDLDRLTSMFLDEICTTMHIRGAAMFLKHEESGEFHLTARRGLDTDAALKLRQDHPVLSWLSSRDKVLTWQQIDVLPQFKGLWIQEREDLQRIEAQLFVPLMVREELIGILVLGPKHSDTRYSADEQRTLTTLANQGAVAIENAHLFALEQRKAAESSALLDIAKAVSSTVDLNRLLKIVGRRTAQVCGVDRCSMLLLDEETGKLMPLMSQFGHGAGDQGLWQTFRERTYIQTIDQVPLVQQVLRERQPVVLDGDSMSLLPSSWLEPFGIKSLLVVPLISKDRVIGLMVLDHAEEGRGFADEQVNLATMIGSQASIAIESARLYEETIEEKERTETIVEQAFAGIMVVDSATRIVAMNPEAEAISGYGSQELLGKRLMDVFEPELWGEESLLAQVVATGERVAPAEAHLVGKNGSRDILLGVTRIGESYLLNFADITELKEVDRLKSSIVANVSHELRAPLASIKAYTELLLDDLDGEDRALRHRFLSVIDGEADRLTELITDLLDLSRLESQQFQAQMDLLSIAEIVEGVIARPDIQLLNGEVTVDSDVAADLPPIIADKELITVLVKNLVSNAVKFSPEGGRVEVKVRHVGDDLVLEVADWGMGIPPEDLPHLFTKFFRSGLAKESGIRGTGLGLVLAKEAADMHGGMIDVESELGIGTRFTVTLPIERESRAEGRTLRESMNG